jgi:regulator of replication initiation timing
MNVELILTIGGLAVGLGINQLWTRKRTAGQVANEFAQAASTMLGPLEKSVTRLNDKVAVLERNNQVLIVDNEKLASRVSVVERENHILTVDNTRLRARVEALEKQLHGLGVKPEPETKGARQ